jgi:hypothetical protein
MNQLLKMILLGFIGGFLITAAMIGIFIIDEKYFTLCI